METVMRPLPLLLLAILPVVHAQSSLDHFPPPEERWRAAAQVQYAHKECAKHGFKVDYEKSANTMMIIKDEGERRGKMMEALDGYLAEQEKADDELKALRDKSQAEKDAFYKKRCGELATHAYGSRFIQEK
jgi:hypothetical protein